MAAAAPAPNDVDAVLTDIGLTQENRYHITQSYSNDLDTFAALWVWGLGFSALKDMEAQVFQHNGANQTFSTTPPQRNAIQGFALWLHTTIAQGLAPDVQAEYLNEARIQRAWIGRATLIYQSLKRKTDSSSRVEDNLVSIEKGALKTIGMWEKVKEMIDHGLRLMSSDNEVGNLRYLTRPDMANVVAGAPHTIIDEAFGRNFDKMQYATLSIHYPSEGVEIPDTAVMFEENRSRVETDSERLWDIIAKVVQDQPTYELVRKYRASRDGIGAYRRLREEAEGSTSKTTKRARAYSTIKTTVFTGKSPRFGWSAFVAKQEGAFAVLAENGEPQAESRKVNELLSHITDPRLESAKDHITGDDTKLNNYNLAAQYFGTCLANRANSTTIGAGRNVGLTDSERKDKEEREAHATEQKTSSGVKWQDGRFLPKAEYAKLYDWEKEAHRKIVAALPADKKKAGRRRNKRKSTSDGDDAEKDGKKRKVKTVETKAESSAKAGTDGATKVPTTTAAGDQFGRNSHTNKKKGVSFDGVTKKTSEISLEN